MQPAPSRKLHTAGVLPLRSFSPFAMLKALTILHAISGRDTYWTLVNLADVKCLQAVTLKVE